jgi:phenylpyruvate tautomerase PptA (4-oxalocrotonate tautomerase family)
MPMIRVEMLPGRSADQKRAFAKSVTTTAAESQAAIPLTWP